MNKELIIALKELEREKGINLDILIDALKVALVSAYKKNYKVNFNARVDLDFDSGEIKVFKILDEDVAEKEGISEVDVTPENFGRIAAQTAKQVITQKIKEAEREVMYDEYKERAGDMVIGIIQQHDARWTLVDLGKVEALLPSNEQVPGEKYKHGERIKCYISEVRKTTKGPQVIVSRTHSGLIRRLFELEVPEIYEGIVTIKSIAREAGHRTKIAVSSSEKNVDPVGACVGPKGSRVRMVVDELAGEKIDIVQYSDDIVTFIKNALSPAKVIKVLTDEETKFALVVVPNEQLSLAIGRDGQNARLAAKLTNWKIDIKSESQYEDELNAARNERK
ncbi:MAG: transcription termination factor NusA, partial [Actinobacteria bacterium]|nr:transcription termination factor NusA [Actinomycetota bacterium]